MAASLVCPLKFYTLLGQADSPLKSYKTRTESKTLDTFVILEHQGVLGI